MGGISIPALSSAALTGAGRIVVFAAANAQNGNQGTPGQAVQFRPPQWSRPALTMLTISAPYVPFSNQPSSLPDTGQVDASGNEIFRMDVNQKDVQPNAAPQYLIFDGVIKLDHSQPMTSTDHPVQDAANMSDHIRANQALISLEVLMTDVLPPFAAGQWVGNPSKSISCFQTLDSLRLNRVPLTLTTRLKTYFPVFIMNVLPDETYKTQFGFRGRIEFKQLNLFSVASQTVGARQQTTGNTTLGQTNPVAVPAGVTAQNGLPSSSTGVQSSSALQNQTGTIIGAGNWDSNPTGKLINFLRTNP